MGKFGKTTWQCAEGVIQFKKSGTYYVLWFPVRTGTTQEQLEDELHKWVKKAHSLHRAFQHTFSGRTPSLPTYWTHALEIESELYHTRKEVPVGGTSGGMEWEENAVFRFV